MHYCKKCLTPDTRPNGKFNEEGICIPCEYSNNSSIVNFDERLAELKKITNKLSARNRNKRWQCIVGVSGGKDSTRQALWTREKLGLNPLLVSVVYPPKQIAQVGADNLSNLINLGFDVLALGPAPRLSSELVREAFFRFCNWLKATEMCLFAGVPNIAIERKIPLILWGENPALQVGDMGTLGASIWDGSNLANSNTIAGGDLTWFTEVAGDVNRLPMYMYPAKEAMVKNRVQTIFLGPAWPDWSSETNSRIALAHGIRYRGGDPALTGDLLGTRMVDEDWTIVNMLLKYYKLGFSRGTEQANAAIREGLITREEGIQMAEKYDEACGDEYIESFCRYIRIDETTFWATVKKFTNTKLFDITTGRRPKKKFKVGVGMIE
ncbi:MAG: LPS biosynthesis protein [Leptospira sp.]|nr:MAG: LPS biosynthesis protein [Leptospira sp.]